MTKNYSLYMLGIFLGLGSLIGFVFPYLVRSFIEISSEDFLPLQLAALGAGWLLAALNFGLHYAFNRYIIWRFRGVLARVRDEDYSARVDFTSHDMLGLMADDVNATLSHLEKKNEEVLHDDLTGLANRQFLKQYYRKNYSLLNQQTTAFMFFDLDKFKEINDRFGHLYGDEVLIQVADRVRSALAEGEFLVRLSGDEFLLVAPVPEDSSSKELAAQLAALFTEPFAIFETAIQVETSIGVSTAPANGDDLSELIRKADFAMYEAKKAENLTYYLFDEERDREITEIAGVQLT